MKCTNCNRLVKITGCLCDVCYTDTCEIVKLDTQCHQILKDLSKLAKVAPMEVDKILLEARRSADPDKKGDRHAEKTC